MNILAAAARLIPHSVVSDAIGGDFERAERVYGIKPLEVHCFGAAPALRVIVTSRVGKRTHPVTKEVGKYHNGTDYSVPVGTGVIATEGGKVVSVFVDESINGTALVIDHRPAGLPFLTSYVHLSAIITPKGFLYGKTDKDEVAAMAASLKGSTVRRGQLLGLSGGKPGDWGAGRSTGPHLHLGMKRFDGATSEDVESLDYIDWGMVEVAERGPDGHVRSLPQ